MDHVPVYLDIGTVSIFIVHPAISAVLDALSVQFIAHVCGPSDNETEVNEFVSFAIAEKSVCT